MRRGPRVRKAKAAFAAWTRLLLLSSAATVMIVASAWAAWTRALPYVTDHDYFRLRSIRVSSDETRVSPQALAEIAGLYDDESLWDVDPEAIQQSLTDASWVRRASVSRHFPWQVSLTVARRHGVAAAVADGKAFLVDQGGVLFHEIEEASVPDLPYLTGWDSAPTHAERAGRLHSLLGVLEKASGRAIEVSELHMDEDGTVWLYATGIKASVRLGDPSRARTSLDRLALALSELGGLADRARMIDVDYRDRIVIRGADDKLPAMLTAQAEKALATREGDIDASDERAPRRAGPAGTAARESETVPGTNKNSTTEGGRTTRNG